MNILLLVFLSTGVLLIALALPLMRRTVPPNGWYGLRVEATFADEWVWYEANAHSGRDLVVLGVVQIVSAIILRIAAVPELAYALANTGIVFAGSIVFAIVGIRRANRLADEKRRTPASPPV